MSQSTIPLQVNQELFSAEFTEQAGSYTGNVYPMSEWWGPNGTSGIAYQSRSEAGGVHEKLNEDCRSLFEFSFCWRGVWEGRVYFKEQEYWSEDLAIMAALWTQLESELKALIRNTRPSEMLED